METVRVHVVEVDAKRLSVGMFNQLEHKSYKNDSGELQGEPLGWVRRKHGHCSSERHLLMLEHGELSDGLYLDCPSYWSEINNARWHAIWPLAHRRYELAEVPTAVSSNLTQARYWISQEARRIMKAYAEADPRLDEDERNRITSEVAPLEAQHRMLEALPQLFVGR